MRTQIYGTRTLGLIAALSLCLGCTPGSDTRIPIMFTGGYETDERDGGRPVILIASALNVSPDVFRNAFSGVTPARGGPPSGEQARKNKDALLKVLGPHGVTNERLDEVSDHYRYRPQEGELWTHRPASAYAAVENGQITAIVLTDKGAGYSSTPSATITGHEGVSLEVKLRFDRDLETNGSIASIEIANPNKLAK